MKISSQEVDSNFLGTNTSNNQQSNVLDASRFVKAPIQEEKVEMQDQVAKQALEVLSSIQKIADITDHRKKSEELRKIFPANASFHKTLPLLNRVELATTIMNGSISDAAKKIIQAQIIRFKKQREREFGGEL